MCRRGKWKPELLGMTNKTGETKKAAVGPICGQVKSREQIKNGDCDVQRADREQRLRCVKCRS